MKEYADVLSTLPIKGILGKLGHLFFAKMPKFVILGSLKILIFVKSIWQLDLIIFQINHLKTFLYDWINAFHLKTTIWIVVVLWKTHPPQSAPPPPLAEYWRGCTGTGHSALCPSEPGTGRIWLVALPDPRLSGLPLPRSGAAEQQLSKNMFCV